MDNSALFLRPAHLATLALLLGIGITYTYYAGVCKFPDTKQSTHYRSSLDGDVRLYF